MSRSKETEEFIRGLYVQHANDIYRYARLMLADHSLARDVVQEVFMRVLRSVGKFRNEANPKTWLLSIARNYIVDLLRRKQTEQRVMSTFLSAEIIPDSVGSLETKLFIQEALLNLKDSYRHVIVLRHIQSYSVEETAQILGWTKSNVKTTDQRALAKLREILSGEQLEVNRE